MGDMHEERRTKMTLLKKTAVMLTVLTICSIMAVLIVPDVLWAAACSANCEGGAVSCTGATCSANDGVGCAAYNSGGVLIQIKSCPPRV